MNRIYDADHYAEMDAEEARFDAHTGRLQDWLLTVPQDLWLDVARRANWDIHNKLLLWMVNQPQCDLSVAAHVLHYGSVAYYYRERKVPQVGPGDDGIVATVLANYEKGFYRAHAINIDDDPTIDVLLNNLNDAMAETDNPAFIIPDAFLDLTGGAPVAIPAELSPDDAADVWPLFDAIDLSVAEGAPGAERDAVTARKARDTARFRWLKETKNVKNMGLVRRSLKYRKYFDTDEDYNVFMGGYFLDRPTWDQQAATFEAENPGKAFTDSPMFYGLVFVTALVVFGVYEFGGFSDSESGWADMLASVLKYVK